MKPQLIILLIVVSLIIISLFSSKLQKPITVAPRTTFVIKENNIFAALSNKAKSLKKYIAQKKFSKEYVFLINMGLPSGKKRFFIYDLQHDSIVNSGLVAHGSCLTGFSEEPVFSNVPDCGCSSIGKYKIDYAYDGQFGKAFKLYGLDSTNSNAFKRTIVLHAYDCVPDEETEPKPICNSLGCPMVSYKFLHTLTGIIENSKKPVLLSMYR